VRRNWSCLPLLWFDRDGVYGSPRFHMAAKSVGVRAHVGAEISVEGFGNRAGLASWIPFFLARAVRLPLLVESRIGYQNLCRLMTRYKLREKEKGTGTATLERSPNTRKDWCV